MTSRAANVDDEIAAAFWRRVLALAVDNVLVFYALNQLFGLVGVSLQLDAYWLGFLIVEFWFVSLPAIGLYWVVAFALSEWLGRGRTPGKALVGIAIRRADDGGQPHLGQLLCRELWRMLYFACLVWPFVLDGLASLHNPQGQAWHDKRAATHVVRVRRRATVSVGHCAP